MGSRKQNERMLTHGDLLVSPRWHWDTKVFSEATSKGMPARRSPRTQESKYSVVTTQSNEKSSRMPEQISLFLDLMASR